MVSWLKSKILVKKKNYLPKTNSSQLAIAKPQKEARIFQPVSQAVLLIEEIRRLPIDMVNIMLFTGF